MARTKGQQRAHNDMIADARKKIREAGIVDLLIQIAQGHPLAEYEPRTNPRQRHAKLKRHVRPNVDQRLRAASELMGRAYPQLKAVDLGQADGPVTIKIETGFALPGQAQPDVEGTVVPQIEDQVVDVLNEIVEAEIVDEVQPCK